MNEKIKELWDKAVTLVEQEPDGDWSLDTIKDNFAELIIKECVGILEPKSRYMGEGPEVLKDKIRQINQHFGVEE
jgi:hypothetical protein